MSAFSRLDSVPFAMRGGRLALFYPKLGPEFEAMARREDGYKEYGHKSYEEGHKVHWT